MSVAVLAVAHMCFCCQFVLGADAQVAGVRVSSLPQLTGPFHIGRVTTHLTDSSRIEPLSMNHEARELMVDVWYPAEPSQGTPAGYLDVTEFEHALGFDGFRKEFGTASDAIHAGLVRGHAIADAQFAHSLKGSPVLIFSPGGRMIKEVYAAQLEEYASHGYVVAAVSHTYDAIVAVFPGGRSIAYSSKRWPAIPSLEGEANLNQLEWHANDIRFVLDELTHLNKASAYPFAGHVDLSRVGAFGHSLGGLVAAHACQIDSRLKACLNEDGEVAKRPFYLDNRGWGMDQAFMLIARSSPTAPPSDAELAAMKLTGERAVQIMSELQNYQDTALRSTGKGSYRVLLASKTITHADFSDLPLIGAHDSAEAEMHGRVLQEVRRYTRAFFDQYLAGVDSPVLRQRPGSEFVESVQRFKPAKLPARCQ